MRRCFSFRALARSAVQLHGGILGLVVGASFATTSALAQDSSVAVEQALRVVGSDGSTQIVEFNNDARAELAAGPRNAELTQVPLANGRFADFALERFEVFTEGAELAATDGTTTTSIAHPDVVYYRGHGIQDPAETVFFSVEKEYDGEIHMLSSHPKRGTSVLSPQRDAYGRMVLRLGAGGDSGLEPFACGADLLPETQKSIQAMVEPAYSVDVRSATTLETEMVIDVSHHLYTTAFGSDTNRALAYVGNLIGASSAIFQRDINVVLKVKLAHVWTTADPFDGSSSSAQLANYVSWNKANRAGVTRDAAHYLAGRRSYGGIAYIGGLCSMNYGFGVSNIYGTVTYPTSSYTWDVNCVSHELGHNFNSPHTHCYSPPIDCCYTSECGGCGNTTADPGTIMSYCHLVNGGSGVGMYFHQRTKDLMRVYSEARPCLSATTVGGETGGNSQISGSGNNVTIANGDWTPTATDGTIFGDARVGGTAGGITRTFTIRNNGGSTLNLTGQWPVVVTGTNAGDFHVTWQPSATIAAGASTTFKVTFLPNALGTRSAMVYIPTNDPVNSLYTFWMTGTGVVTAPFSYSFGGNTAIPDNNLTGVSIPVSVSNFPGLLGDVSVRIDGGSCSSAAGATGVGLTHSNMADLRISLRSPAGTEVVLMSGAGGTGNNLCQVTFDDTGSGPSINNLAAAAAPYSGSYWPVTPLAYFKGQNPNGTWTLRVRDSRSGDTGSVRAFTLLMTPKDKAVETFSNTAGWLPTGSSIPGLAVAMDDSVGKNLKVWIGPHSTMPRVLGWKTSDVASSLPYAVVGPDRYVRAKFHVYAGGQSSANVAKIPNLRMRIGNRFAVSSILEVLHHSNADPESARFGYDVRPSWNAATPSVYRVDYDPIDVPYLKANGNAETITRTFEAYALEPQEDGFVALTESSIAAYPALSNAAGPVIKVYSPERGDFSGTVFSTYNITKPVTWPVSIQATGGDLPRATKAAKTVQLDTLLVPSGKMGIATADIIPGAASEDYSPTRRARVEENKLYKIRFHASSAQTTNRQAQIRFRARTGKFSWNQRLEVGGAWAIGTNSATGNAAIAQQSLPGIGCQNPDRIGAGDVGAWYTMLFHSPMSRDIRLDYGNVPLTTSMPNLSGQDRPGVHTGRTRRDIMLGVDLIDTISVGPNAYLERGQVNLNRIEIRAYNRAAD